MLPRQRPFLVLTLTASLLGSHVAAAQDVASPTPWPLGSTLQTEDGQRIPAGTYGAVIIDSPREATLLNLRGMVGTGMVILRDEASRDCLTMPVRLVAGDFGGNTVSTRSVPRIRVLLRSARVARALADGRDIVSDMYRVGSAENDRGADIVIESGLRDGQGFVLNPGGSVLADIFGVEKRRVPCSEK